MEDSTDARHLFDPELVDLFEALPTTAITTENRLTV